MGQPNFFKLPAMCGGGAKCSPCTGAEGLYKFCVPSFENLAMTWYTFPKPMSQNLSKTPSTCTERLRLGVEENIVNMCAPRWGRFDGEFFEFCLFIYIYIYIENLLANFDLPCAETQVPRGWKIRMSPPDLTQSTPVRFVPREAL